VVAIRRVDGAVVWSVPTAAADGENRANRPVVVGDVVVATAADGLVLGLDRATGAERWRLSLPTATTAEPAAGGAAGADPVVVVVGIAQWRALEPATGATLWSADIGLFGTSSPVVYASGRAARAAVATNGQVIAVDARTGAPAWEAPGDQSELFQVPVVAANGTELLVPDHWGRLSAYDPHDGRRFWSVKGADTVAEFGEPVLVGDRLVALPLDAKGPRLGSPDGSVRIKPPADGHGVADLPLRGLVVTTWGGAINYVLLYEVR
jgi:outer membrane protein assembly factor BamB